MVGEIVDSQYSFFPKLHVGFSILVNGEPEIADLLVSIRHLGMAIPKGGVLAGAPSSRTMTKS